MFEQVAATLHDSSGQNSTLDTLPTRFAALWRRCSNSKQPVGSDIFRKLNVLYSEPFRQYHNFNHISYCLRQFDQCTALMDEPDAVELGLWFHDAVYVTGAKDNERRSADLFLECAVTASSINTTMQQRVVELIMNTTHNARPTCRDGKFIMDIDVSGFGQPWEDFMRDGAHLRAESSSTEDRVYYAGLLRFMRFLSFRPTFFFTHYFQQHYEHTAQDNLRRLIADLTLRGYG